MIIYKSNRRFPTRTYNLLSHRLLTRFTAPYINSYLWNVLHILSERLVFIPEGGRMLVPLLSVTFKIDDVVLCKNEFCTVSII